MRKVLITGAARGVGFATAARMRKDGYEVVTLDRSPGCDIQADIYSDPLDPGIFGTIDIIVANAAAVDIVAPSQDMTMDQWNRDINVNLTGTWRTIQACLKGMRERRWGRIIAISSGCAEGGMPDQIAYAASKTGILGVIRTLATEHARYGITANTIMPGMIGTEAFDAVPPEAKKKLIAAVPRGQLGSPEEVAHLIAFLASELSGHVTGEAIGIDGGVGLLQITRSES